MSEFETKPTQELDLSTREYQARFAEAPLYAKKVSVHARPAIAGEVITTTLANGLKETDNTAMEGDHVITNPGGEEYIVKAEKFAQLYAPTDEEGVFRATGVVRAFKNPTGGNIKIQASWGEEQVGDAECMLASSVDLSNPDKIDSGRIIGGQEFKDTYGTYEEVYGPLDS